jgi:serine/threonine-protein kinase
LALDTIEFLLTQPKWKQPPPELLVLKAQLKEAYLGKGDISSWDSVKEECQALCVEAQKVLPGFAPAGDLLRRLERMEEVTLYMGVIFDDKYKVTATSFQRGSFGQVYRAELLQPVSGVKAVALKVIGGYADASGRRDRAHLLEREVRILKNLNHPNIAQYVGFVANPLCLVMEWVDGQTVDALVRGKNRFPWQKVASIGYQIADALRYAKEVTALDGGVDEDFAHRDLHAGNIMIAQEPSGILKAKLLDFGLARLPGDSSTISSFVKKHGNAFMPYRDPYWPNGGILGDIFSFGIILFELTCGCRPFPDGALGEYQRSRKDPDDLLTQMRKIPPETSKEFGEILIKMLQPEIQKRYQRWEDLIRDLDKLSEARRSALSA